MKIVTLTNEISDNLSLLGDGCSLLKMINQYENQQEKNFTSGFGSGVNNDAFSD
jgi:hypothetical protein